MSLPAESMPEVGVLPSPLVEEPGEAPVGAAKHYKGKGTSSPLCPIGPEGATYATKWADVTCTDCVDLKPKRGRKKKEDDQESDPGKPKPQQKAKAKTDTGPEPREAMEAVLCMIVDETLYQNRRAPAPRPYLVSFAGTVVHALDYYGMLTFTTHPLGAVAATSVALFLTIKDSPEIHDQKELDKLHGKPDVQA